MEFAAEHAVTEVRADAVVLEGGETVPADRVVWATGAAPIPLLGDLGLATDDAGFLAVGDTLQSVDDERVFAVGDCAAIRSAPWVPKAGVHAVRQGPTLDANLRAFLGGRALRKHRPQRDFLSLLTADRKRAIRFFNEVVKTDSQIDYMKKEGIAADHGSGRRRPAPEHAGPAPNQTRNGQLRCR